MKKETKKKVIKLLKVVSTATIVCAGIVLLKRRFTAGKPLGEYEKIYSDNDDPLKVFSGKVGIIKKKNRVRFVEDIGNDFVDFVNVDIPKGTKNVRAYDKASGNSIFNLKPGEVKEIIISGDYNFIKKLKSGYNGFDASTKIKGVH